MICSNNAAAWRPAPAASFRVEAAATAPRQAPLHCRRASFPARRRLRARLVPKSSSHAFLIGANDGDDDALPSTSASTTPSTVSPSTAAADPMRPYRRAQARSMLRFMLPAALIPLADPLLTLVDVLFVSHGGDLFFPPAAGGGAAGALGRAFLSSSSSSSPLATAGGVVAATATEQLAALSPNAQIFTFIQYMLGGLGERVFSL